MVRRHEHKSDKCLLGSGSKTLSNGGHAILGSTVVVCVDDLEVCEELAPIQMRFYSKLLISFHRFLGSIMKLVNIIQDCKHYKIVI